MLATAILDRLPHHCEVLAINGPSHPAQEPDDRSHRRRMRFHRRHPVW
ncbi:ATP-binding protein [Actinomadura formosensis]